MAGNAGRRQPGRMPPNCPACGDRLFRQPEATCNLSEEPFSCTNGHGYGSHRLPCGKILRRYVAVLVSAATQASLRQAEDEAHARLRERLPQAVSASNGEISMTMFNIKRLIRDKQLDDDPSTVLLAAAFALSALETTDNFDAED